MKNIIVAILTLGMIASCETNPITINKDPSGSGGNSSSSSSDATSSAVSSSSSSSSGQGNGGGPILSCDPCENVDGSRLIRQRSITSTVDGLHVVSNAGYWDILRNEACFPLAAEDKSMRCIPSGSASLSNYYSDAICTNQIAFAPKFVCGGNAPKYAQAFVTSSDPCVSGFFETRTIGAKYGGTELYTKSGNSCTLTPKLAGYDYFLIGSAISPSEFVEVKTELVH